MKKAAVQTLEIKSLRDCIHVIRGVQVMLDFDLAAIYGYSTKDFNRQVKNNIEKFDADFMFRLTEDEMANLRCKFSTSSWGGARYAPHAFTEQGVYMLMTVLRGELAIRQSKALIRTFKQMKDYVVRNSGLLDARDLVRLSIETARNTDEISALKDSLVKIDNQVADIADSLGHVVTKSELATVVRDFSGSSLQQGWLILNGQPVESDLAYAQIYAESRKSILVIDNYIGLKTLVLLKEFITKRQVTVFSDNLGKGLHRAEYLDFCNEYGAVELRSAGGLFHDRYIILDYGLATERIYHCGASSKDGGNRVMTIERVSDVAPYRKLLGDLLNNPKLVLK